VEFTKSISSNPTTSYVVASVLHLETGKYEIETVTVNFQTWNGKKWHTMYSQSSPTQVVVKDICNNDIFTTSPQDTRFIQLQTVFSPPVNFNEKVNINIIIELNGCGGKLTFNQQLPITPIEDRYKEVKLLVESIDVFADQGTYTNFNTNIGRTSELGVVGNEFVQDSGTRFVTVIPFPITSNTDRIYFCKSTLWKEDKVLVIELDNERFQFLCDRGLTLFSTEKVVVPSNVTPLSGVKIWSAEQWASDTTENCGGTGVGILTNLWNNTYGGNGFTLTSTSGDTVLKVNTLSSLIAILDQMSAVFGDLDSGEIDNPLSTSAGGALASVIWLKLSIDSNKIGNLLFSAKFSLLLQQQTDVAAVNQGYEKFNGKTYNQILQLLFDVVCDEPGTELKALYNSVQMIVYRIIGSMYLVRG